MSGRWVNGDLVHFLSLPNIAKNPHTLMGLEIPQFDVSYLGIPHSGGEHGKDGRFVKNRGLFHDYLKEMLHLAIGECLGFSNTNALGPYDKSHGILINNFSAHEKLIEARYR